MNLGEGYGSCVGEISGAIDIAPNEGVQCNALRFLDPTASRVMPQIREAAGCVVDLVLELDQLEPQ